MVDKIPRPRFPYPWFDVDGDDFADQELEDGTVLDAVAMVIYAVDGRTEYFGLVLQPEDAEEEDD